MVILITGKANSGKDTVASMIDFLFKKSTSTNNLTYEDYKKDLERIKFVGNPNILHFADIPKQSLATILNIPVRLFNDREYKDNRFYVPSRNDFLTQEQLERIISQQYNLKFYPKSQDTFKEHKHFTVITKLRNILQDYCEGIKEIFGKDFWAKMAYHHIKTVETAFKYAIVPDLRFIEEYEVLKDRNPIVIEVIRKDNSLSINHVSEKGFTKELNRNITINNDYDEKQLFEIVKIKLENNIEEYENYRTINSSYRKD